ncbi:MAG: LarC family nickel insertion protein, partial [Lachnospiraceae bacterium]|nr:LarC family nickel insertion protein [Lachnospiraceae bacterium]
YERPSILRAMLIDDTSEKAKGHSDQSKADGIWKLESNLDDCSGEALGFVMEELLAAGARDVHYTPVYMKKNRPGWQLNVICDEEQIETMEQLIFSHTTTIGIRKLWMQRSVLKRESRQIDTPYGKADIKICYGPQKKSVPEYESVARLAREQKLSFVEIYRIIEELANSL